MNKNLLIVGVLVLLVLVTIVQAVQLNGIKNDLSSSGAVVKTTASSSSSSTSAGSASVPTNLQNLPGMVGGC